jgi:small subunit ribosomal protein S3
MSHKVHPKAYRLRRLADWDSRWLDKKKSFRYLEEDFKIREFLKKEIGKLGLERIEIERFSGKLNIIISTAKPGLIIGRGGSGVEELKKKLENKIIKKDKKSKRETRIEIREVKDVWASAMLTAQNIAYQIEKRMKFRRALKQTLEKIMFSRQVKGARIEISGRLDGAEIARREWLQKGRLPRQTLRADIDFAQIQAYCIYGTIGIKVWIYKGEKFDE